MKWYIKAVKNYAGFDGRAHRTEFWMFSLISLIISIVLGLVDYAFGFGGLSESAFASGPLESLYSLVILLPSLAVGARRLHDIGRSGWWQLLVLTIIGIILLIIWWAMAGKKETNDHGPEPWSVDPQGTAA